MNRLWRNWSRNQTCRPRRVVKPHHLDGLVSEVRAARDDGLHMRVAGTGHSISPLALTDGCLISTERLDRILRIEGNTIEVEAGAHLIDVAEAAWEAGLSLEGGTNYARMSVGGIAATGAHGSSRLHGTLTSRVEAVTLVRADGEVVRIGRDDLDALRAARLHLGMLGAVYALTLRCEPAHAMRVDYFSEPRGAALERLEEMLQAHDHVSLYTFPGSSSAWWYLADRVSAAPAQRPWRQRARLLSQYAVNRGVGAAIFPMMKRAPRLTPHLLALGDRFQTTITGEVRRSVDAYHYLWAVPRFLDAAMLMDVEHARPALDTLWASLARWARDGRHPINMAIQLRQLGPDDACLSPTLGRRCAAIECVTAPGTPGAEAFLRDFTRDLGDQFAARPHWAKLAYHPSQLSAFGARRTAFDRVRRRFDPDGWFLNAACREILGPELVGLGARA